MTITNGVVSIEDGTKAKEEFAPARKVRVEFTFAVEEGDDPVAVVDHVRALASSRVDLELNRSAKEPATSAALPQEGVNKPGRKPRATSAKEPAPVVETSAPGSDKAVLEAAAGLTQAETKPVEQKKPEPVVEDDNIDDLLGDAAPVPITDAELAKAAQNKNAQMKVKDPNFSVKIRALVVEYAGQPPKKITDVPVAKRQEFLDKLRDLT